MIQYVPIEYSMFEGADLYVVLCIWVHGHKQGRGDYRKRGMGKALLKAAEDDSRQLGTNGLVTWGLVIPVFMQASWFRRQGYTVVDKNGMMRLLWKPFNDTARPPRFIRPKKHPETDPEKVVVSIFRNGWCPAMNIACEMARRASAELGDSVQIREFDTFDRELVKEWGITDGLYIDKKEIRTGPPASFAKIRRTMAHKVRMKRWRNKLLPKRIFGMLYF
jgi:hypothetical protein